MTKPTVLITGGAKGIGQAIALTFAKNNYNVVFTYLGSEKAAQLTKEMCEGFTDNVLSLRCDVTDSHQVKEVVNTVLSQFGTIDVLVNNAGITKDNLILRMSEAQFDEVIDANLKGAFNLIQAVSKPMFKQRFGRIINISSVVGISGNLGQANYAASKAGIIAMTKSVAKELASRNVTCNCVAPGFIETKMTDQLNQDIKDRMLTTIPLKRFGQPQDIADTVYFLSSSCASYITGQTVVVDGGLLMGGF